MLDNDQNGDANGRACAAGSAGCTGGVDNQLPAVVDALGQFMAGLDVGALLSTQINEGGLILLARVSDVNGTLGPTLCDDSVTIRLYLGYPMFSNCANVQMPNQMYAISASSVTNPMDPASALIQFQGRIVNGRLRVVPSAAMADRPSLSIPLPISGVQGLSLDLYNTQLRVTMNADGTGSNGNLGGFILKRDLLTALSPRAAAHALPRRRGPPPRRLRRRGHPPRRRRRALHGHGHGRPRRGRHRPRPRLPHRARHHRQHGPRRPHGGHLRRGQRPTSDAGTGTTDASVPSDAR